MKRSAPLRRHTRVCRRNERRLRRLRAVQFGPQAALCRTLPCSTCGAPPSDPSHLKTRGAGGLDDSCIAQCRRCHIALGSEGIRSFFAKRGFDPDVILAKVRNLVACEQSDAPVSPLLGVGGWR